MSIRRPSVYKNSTIYLLVSFLQKALGFLLLPLYTAILSPKDYGTINVVTSIGAIVAVLFNLSLHGASMRFYYKCKDDPAQVSRIWGTNITFVALNTAVLLTLFIVTHRVLLDPFAEGIAFYPYLLIGIISSALGGVFLFYQAMLQARQDGRGYGLNNLVFFVLNTILTVVFLVVFRWSAVGVLAASAISNAFFFYIVY